MSEKEVKPEEEVVEEQVQEAPQEYELQIHSEQYVRYDEYCGFASHEGGNAWVKLVGPDGIAESWGYFPAQYQEAAFEPTTGRVDDPSHTGYTADEVKSFTLKPQQADKVRAAAHRKSVSPGQYDFINNNCATFAAEMASEAGLSLSVKDILLPNQKAVIHRIAQLQAEAAAGKTLEVESEE